MNVKRVFFLVAASAMCLAGCRENDGMGSSTPQASARSIETAEPAAPSRPTAPTTPTTPVAEAQPMAAFGEALSDRGETVTVAQLLGNLSRYENKPVRVTGTVDKVCEHAGCWLQMADGEKALFVKFTCPTGGRLVPLEAVGHKVVAAGQLKIVEVSEEEARHIAEEAGEPAEKIEQIKGPQKRITLESPGAVVYGITK